MHQKFITEMKKMSESRVEDILTGVETAPQSRIEGLLNNLMDALPTDEHIHDLVGAPLCAFTASAMTDQTKIYIYTGDETGYTEGHWYYYNGTAWTDGGVYNSAGINTDKTLSVEDKAADGKAVGDAITSLNGDLSEIDGDIDAIYNGRTVQTIGTNKLNPQEIENETKIEQNGTTSEYSGTWTTGFISLDHTKANVAFTGNNANGTARVCLPVYRIAFYDSNKVHISHIDNTSSNNIISIPQNAIYTRLNILNTYTDRMPMVELVDNIGEISTAFIAFEEITVEVPGLSDLTESVNDMESQITQLNNLPSEVEENTEDLKDILGVSRIISELATFDYGYISSRGDYKSQGKYRIATPDYISITKDMTLYIADGFRVYLCHYDDNNTVLSLKWITDKVLIEAGARIRMTIARVVEDTSEIADIDAFCSKAIYIINDNIVSISETLKYINAVVPYGLTWDWWIKSSSIDKYGNVYIGYIDTEAYAGVLQRQPDGIMVYKRLESSYNDDDHNGMATIVLDDGRILVIGSYGHAQSNHVICYRSSEPYSIENMEKLSFDVPETGEYKYSLTYSQIYKYDGKLFDFMRVSVQQNSTTIENGTGYLCLVSTDNGSTWTVYKAVQSSDPYISFCGTSNDSKIIKGIYTNNPGTRPVNMMKGFTFDMSSYEFKNLSGTKIGELVLLNGGEIADENVAHYADMTDLVQRGETNKSCRLFFTGHTQTSKTAFLYAIAEDSTNADWVYKLYDNGTIIDIGHSGVPFGNNTYISGACFGKDISTVYYAKATTSLADGSHELHKVKIANGAVVSDEIIAETSICMIRPLFLGNGEVATVIGQYNDQTVNGYNGSFTAWELKPMFVHA